MTQAEAARYAASDLHEALNPSDMGRVDARRTTARAFYSAQGILTAAALMSKLLWPPSTDRKHRGRALREAVGITGDHALGRRSREVRNAFEHFDECLDDFLDRIATQPGPRIIADRNVGDPSTIVVVNGAAAPEHLRLLDHNLEVSVLNVRASLTALLGGILDLEDRANAWLAAHPYR